VPAATATTNGMQRRLLQALALGLVASACQTTPKGAAGAAAEDSSEEPAAPPPNASYVPSGTVLTVTLTQELSRRTARVGDAFTVAVQNPLIATNRDTVIASGAVITGLVTGVGNAGEQAAIRLNFTRIAIGRGSHPFTAKITATQTNAGESPTSAGGTPLGSVIGEGELRTTLVRGALGAGAGTIISLGTGSDQTLPSGTSLTVQTVDRIALDRR
jgi:hypothetical protein